MGRKKDRTERRAEARVHAKQVRERERLARLEPGGSPGRPIPVVSASLVDPRARSAPCPICGGAVRLEEHTASTIEGRMLRLAHVLCPACGHRRVIYFSIEPALLH